MDENIIFEYITDAAIQISEISINDYINDVIYTGSMTIESKHTKINIDYDVINGLSFIRGSDSNAINTELFELIFLSLIREKIRLLEIDRCEKKRSEEQSIYIKWEE